MSTDKQVYSIDNQRDEIRRYAAQNGLEIVRTFSDEGRSGLTFDERPGLQALLAEVVAGLANFEALVVYDVSRWGRFQDADESAHYEYLCRKAGVSIVYCAEPFLNDVSGYAAAMKGVRRAMAAEYSRELSDKVFAGQRRLIGLGFRQGGRPGLGFRRRLIDACGADKGLLRDGEYKNLQSDRVVLALGPPDEVELVKRIFRMFVVEGRGEEVIARVLNSEGLKTDRGRDWRPETVHSLLTNEKYAGNALFGKTRGRLHVRRQPVAPHDWVRADGAHPAIIEPETFLAAQCRIAQRAGRLSDIQMLEALKRVWRKHGWLSEKLINRTRGAPKAHLYKVRFGSLLAAYPLIGFQPRGNYRFRKERAAFREAAESMAADLAVRLEKRGAAVRRRRSTLDIGGLTLAIQLVRPTQMHGNWRWIPRRERREVDLLALVRIKPDLAEPLDVFLLPASLQSSAVRLRQGDNGVLNPFRFPSLSVIEEVVA